MAYLLSRYARIFEKNGHWWLFHSPTGIAAQFTDDFIQTSEFAQLRSQRVVEESDHEVVDTMRQYGILVDEATYAHEPIQLAQTLQEHIRREDRFELIILPTEKCNFRCPYCYEDFRQGRMSRQVVESVKRLISRKAANEAIRHIHLGWFGGEPLIARDIVFEITEHALNEAHKHSATFAGDITTNGYYLNEAIFSKLMELQIKIYQVTLDGPPEVHNRSRVLFNGGGTFDRIWMNLEAMHRSEADFDLLLRMNVHDGNFEAIKQWIPALGQTFLREEKRFHVHFHAVFTKDLHSKVRSRKMDRIRELYQLALTHHLSVDLQRLFVPFGSVCYASKAHNFVIRSNGDINKCTVAFGIPQNRVGKLTSDGELELNDNYRLWVRETLSHPSCSSCSFVYQCGGYASCPLQPILRGENKRYCGIYRDTENLLPLLAL